MTDRLKLDLELHDAGEYLAQLNVIASPLQGLRDVLDIMPTATTDDWANIASRVSRVPEAIHGYIESLREGARRGLVPARLQVDEAILQAGELADPKSSFFVTFTAGASPGRRRRPPARWPTTWPWPDARPPAPTGSWWSSSPTNSRRRRPSTTPSAGTGTRCGRGSSSARPSTSTRPTSGGWTNWPGWRRSRTGS